MVILIAGEDGYRVQHKREELVAAFRQKFDPTGMNVDVKDGAALSAEELSAAVRTQPFLAPRRMLVVRGLLSRKGDTAAHASALSAHADHLIVIVAEAVPAETFPKNALRKALAAALPKGQLVEYVYPPLSPAELRGWVREEAVRLGTTLEPAAMEALVAGVGPDLWRMRGELEKLAAWRAGQTVRREDVALLVESHLEEDVFAFTDAVGSGDMRAAASVLQTQLTAGGEAFRLIGMVARQLRLLAAARASGEGFAQRFGVHPYAAKKILSQAQRLAPDRIARMLAALRRADRAIKTGRADAEEALQEFLARAA